MSSNRILRFSVVGSSAVLALACGGEPTPKPASPAEAEAAMAKSSADAGAPSAETPTATGETTYRVVVSFTSKGAGIDTAARDQVVEVLNKWRIAKGYEVKTERRRWGKEGELDVCATLDELSDAERSKFVSEVRAVASKSDRVQIDENATCHAERR